MSLPGGGEADAPSPGDDGDGGAEDDGGAARAGDHAW